MSEQFKECLDQMPETSEKDVEENVAPADGVEETVVETDVPRKVKRKLTKRKLVICGIVAIVIAGIAVSAFAFLYKPKFERVKNECLEIMGVVSGDGDYFVLDTAPDMIDDMDTLTAYVMFSDIQERALEAIQHANEELGFSGGVYSKMLETTAVMGRQSEENSRYKVSWTYHPDDGLEVMYERK